MNTDQLRNLLKAGGPPAPPVPDRPAQLARRIRRTTLRRRGTAAAATALALAVAGSVTTASFDNDSQRDTTTVQPGGPESWTAPDGTLYRRIRQEHLDWPRQRSLTLRLPAGQSYAISITCKSSVEGSGAHFSYGPQGKPGKPLPGGFGGATCAGASSPDIVDLPLPDSGSSGEFTVTLQQDTMTENPKAVSGKPASWSVALYSWMPPARRSAPPAPPAWDRIQQIQPDPTGPETYWRKVAQRAGIWPQNTTKFTVPYRGRELIYEISCDGAITDLATVHVLVDGQDLNLTNRNGTKCGTSTSDLNHIPVPKGAKQVTVSFEIGGLPTPYRMRPGSWSIAIYERL